MQRRNLFGEVRVGVRFRVIEGLTMLRNETLKGVWKGAPCFCLQGVWKGREARASLFCVVPCLSPVFSLVVSKTTVRMLFSLSHF